MEPTGVLNGDLFARNEGEDYSSVANELVRLHRRELVRPIIATLCGNVLHLGMKQRGWGRAARKFRKDLPEMWTSAYIFTVSESWETFDFARASELLDEALRGEQALRTRIGSEPIFLDDVDNRCTCTVVGLERLRILEDLGDKVAPADDEPWVALYEYVKSHPSYERIESLQGVYQQVSRVFIKDRHYEAFLLVAGAAWAIGLSAGIVDLMGEIPLARSHG